MRRLATSRAFSGILGLIVAGAVTVVLNAGHAATVAGQAAAGKQRPSCIPTRGFLPDGSRTIGRTSACNASVARKPRPKRKAPPAASRTTAAKPQPAQRAQFDQQEQNAAIIPGIPDARFWGDSEDEFRAALGSFNGSWLALSAGGEDAAFAAGLLSGLSESGRRTDYAVVTGVSSGALLAPFVFLGPSHDAELRRNFTTMTAADVFEDRRTPESLLDTWPLREFMAKRITPELLAEIAAEHRRGRRLIVLTTNIDAGRPVAWNMGAIAAQGGEVGLKLFRDVLLASSSIPGVFPPVLIEAEANGRRIQEMHLDGGLASTIYVAPDSLLFKSGSARLPAPQLTVIVNGKLTAEFDFVDRSVLSILGRSLSLGVKRATRTAVAIIAGAAQRGGTQFKLAYVDDSFDFPSRGLFDPDYMQALFEVGARQGRSAEPFRPAPPQTPPARSPAAPAPPPQAAQ